MRVFPPRNENTGAETYRSRSRLWDFAGVLPPLWVLHLHVRPVEHLLHVWEGVLADSRRFDILPAKDTLKINDSKFDKHWEVIIWGEADHTLKDKKVIMLLGSSSLLSENCVCYREKKFWLSVLDLISLSLWRHRQMCDFPSLSPSFRSRRKCLFCRFFFFSTPTPCES